MQKDKFLMSNSNIRNNLPVLNKRSINQVIDRYLTKYPLYFDLVHLTEVTKSKLKIRHISFPDPIEDLIIGFRKKFSRSLLILPKHNENKLCHPSEELYKTFLFIYVFGAVLDNCSKKDKSHLLKEFSKKCRTNPCASGTLQKIRSFYHELKTIFFFLYSGYKIDCLPERKKQVSGIVPVDAVLFRIETREIINLQCKSISVQMGHPITTDAASLFYNLLKKDKQLYDSLFPLESNFSVEFTFNETLSKNDYTANMLLDDIKQGSSRIKLSKSSEIFKINLKEKAKQKKSQIFESPRSPKYQHAIILHSLHENTFDATLREKVKKDIERQQCKREDNNPIIYSFELYGPQDDENWSSSIITSEDTRLVGTPHPAVTLIPPSILVSWDKLIADVLLKSINNF